jgi:hypothetical protein
MFGKVEIVSGCQELLKTINERVDKGLEVLLQVAEWTHQSKSSR